MQFAYLQPHHKDWFDVSVGQVALAGIDLSTYLSEKWGGNATCFIVFYPQFQDFSCFLAKRLLTSDMLCLIIEIGRAHV